jgi:type I site-specific restriction-modification system R (restriction) subunit
MGRKAYAAGRLRFSELAKQVKGHHQCPEWAHVEKDRLLERSIRRSQNRGIETAQVIEELIALAKDMRAVNARGEELGLTDDELAFYDALETNDRAVKEFGEPTLKMIARELVASVRKNVTIDWTLRENVHAVASGVAL